MRIDGGGADLDAGYAMSQEFGKIKKLYSKLIKRPAILFPNVGQKLKAPDKQGVYLILSPRKKVVHVGRTLRGRRGIAQRLTNHLHNSSSFTEKYLKGKGSKLRGKYWFKFIVKKGARTRALLEAYSVGRLCPKHLGLGD